MSDHILSSHENGVATLRFNRPDKKNAITGDMYAALAAGIDKANADDDVNVILFLGSPGVFTSGNDIADFMQVAMTGERSSMAVFDFLERIIMAPKPMIAGVDGMAIGVGCTMLLHCDHVIAGENTIFKTPFVDLGLVPEAGSSLIGPEVMGHHRAFEFFAMGATFSTEQASASGFVNHVVPSDEVDAYAQHAAQQLAAKPKEALKISRDLIRGDRTPVLERMREESVLFGERLSSDEARQAFAAFMSRGQKKAS
ncbi:MAG: crotonase/enoyl-CoA hydratase family protein [Pseudomonadota bacterium]